MVALGVTYVWEIFDSENLLEIDSGTCPGID